MSEDGKSRAKASIKEAIGKITGNLGVEVEDKAGAAPAIPSRQSPGGPADENHNR